MSDLSGRIAHYLHRMLLQTRCTEAPNRYSSNLWLQPQYAQPQPMYQQPQPMYQQPQPVVPQPTQVIHRGPPLPATGLPEGWTMDQWEYYGQQYLDRLN